MKLSVRLAGAEALARDLARVGEEADRPALDAAADALAAELARTRVREGLIAPLRREAHGGRRRIGADDFESIGRELGDPGRAPAPWLAPVLPGARGPMRAAARTAVARALSRRARGNRTRD